MARFLDPASCCLRPDEEQANRVSLAILSASEDALVPPFAALGEEGAAA